MTGFTHEYLPGTAQFKLDDTCMCVCVCVCCVVCVCVCVWQLHDLTRF